MAGGVELVTFQTQFAKAFAELNYQWIEHYFSVEEEDRLALDHPVEYALNPGGEIFFWLYSHEGNELYLSFIKPIRAITTRLPHSALVSFNWLLYLVLVAYRSLSLWLPLPLKHYLNKVWWPMTPRKRRLVIYDQLNPSYAKYHKQHEAIELLEKAGFTNVKTHHRHGYSWCVWGKKPG